MPRHERAVRTLRERIATRDAGVAEFSDLVDQIALIEQVHLSHDLDGEMGRDAKRRALSTALHHLHTDMLKYQERFVESGEE